MVEKTITQRKKERDQAAIRAARYRQQHASRPDVRAVDKALSEAISIYSKELVPADAEAFLKRMIELSTSGLEIRGYGPKSSRSRTAKRLQSWVAPTLTSGSIRYAQLRDAITVPD